MSQPHDQIDEGTAGCCLILSLGILVSFVLVVVLLVVGVILAVCGA